MPPVQLRQQIAEGLLFAHARLSENTKSTLEASAFLYGLIELLNEKGLLSIKQLDERKQEVAERLAARIAGTLGPDGKGGRA